LQGFDRTLRIRSISAALPRSVAEFLEFSYAAVYPMVPAGLALCTIAASAPSRPRQGERFWAVILLVDYICFATLPWIQTRPPRQLEGGEPWNATFRSLNLRLVKAASIRVNTFPSGHAAEALAVALMVLDVAPSIAGVAMLLGAGAVSAGAVLGRYHYAADALIGWVVALIVVLIVRF
jgi:membrane-associated phospholipid phosphatase